MTINEDFEIARLKSIIGQQEVTITKLRHEIKYYLAAWSDTKKLLAKSNQEAMMLSRWMCGDVKEMQRS